MITTDRAAKEATMARLDLEEMEELLATAAAAAVTAVRVMRIAAKHDSTTEVLNLMKNSF